MRQLEQGVYVSGQIRPEDVPDLAAQGIRTIINNRPDGEALGQPEGGAIHLAAEQAGIGYVNLPVSQLTGDAVDEMRRALARCEQPVLAFCTSGTRSTFLWALARADSADGNALAAKAAEAGYDLAPIRRFLR